MLTITVSTDPQYWGSDCEADVAARAAAWLAQALVDHVKEWWSVHPVAEVTAEARQCVTCRWWVPWEDPPSGLLDDVDQAAERLFPEALSHALAAPAGE